MASREGPPLPPAWFLAAPRDPCLGHPDDVRRLAQEAAPGSRVTVLGKANGNLQDYDHVSMLTHPDAERDHFPAVRGWLGLDRGC